MSGYKRVNYYELCRLCTSSEGLKIHIFCEDGKRRQLQNKIQICLPLQICEDDSLPKIVCAGCVDKLETFYDFRETCVNSETMLESYFTSIRFTDDLLKEGKVYIKEPTGSKKKSLNVSNDHSSNIAAKMENLTTPLQTTGIQVSNTEQQTSENQTVIPLMINLANPQTNDVLQLHIKDEHLNDRSLQIGEFLRIKTLEQIPHFLAQNVCLKCKKCKQLFLSSDDVNNHVCAGLTNILKQGANEPQSKNKSILNITPSTIQQNFDSAVQTQKSPKPKKDSHNSGSNSNQNVSIPLTNILTGNNQNVALATLSTNDLNNLTSTQSNFHLNYNQTNMTNSLIENHFNQSLANFNLAVSQANNSALSNNIITSNASFVPHSNININPSSVVLSNVSSNNLNILNQSQQNGGNQMTVLNQNDIIQGQNINQSIQQNFATNQQVSSQQTSNYLNQNISNLVNKPPDISQQSLNELTSQNLNSIAQQNIDHTTVLTQNLNTSHNMNDTVQSNVTNSTNPIEIDLTDRDPLKIDQCENTVKSSGSSSLSSNNFTCDACQKSFKRKEHLLQHKKLHSGERPFVCQECQKSFSRKEHLIRHSISHTGTKSFQCDMCQKSFSRKDNLHKHKKTHETHAGPYICEFCKKSFIIKHYFLVHKQTHQGENKTTIKPKTAKKSNILPANRMLTEPDPLHITTDDLVKREILKTDLIEHQQNESDVSTLPRTDKIIQKNIMHLGQIVQHGNKITSQIQQNNNQSIGSNDMLKTDSSNSTQVQNNINFEPVHTLHHVNANNLSQNTNIQNTNQNIRNTNPPQNIQENTNSSLQNIQTITQNTANLNLIQSLATANLVSNVQSISAGGNLDFAFPPNARIVTNSNLQFMQQSKHLAQIFTDQKFREKYAGNLKIESIICSKDDKNVTGYSMPLNSIIVVPKSSENYVSTNKVDSPNKKRNDTDNNGQSKTKKVKVNNNSSVSKTSPTSVASNIKTNILYTSPKTNNNNQNMITSTSSGNNNMPTTFLTSNIIQNVQQQQQQQPQNGLFNNGSNSMPVISAGNHFICNSTEMYEYNKRTSS